MSHFLFCIKEYTNKQGDTCRPFLAPLVVLFVDLFVDFLAPLNGVSLASLNDVFSATYRRLFGVEFNDVLAPLNGVLLATLVVLYTIYIIEMKYVA
jgi:hypothetical protein